LYLPISDFRNKNYRFKFVSSIVSISTIDSYLKPIKTRFFKISHPKPPAPTINICNYSYIIYFDFFSGIKSGV